MTGTHAKACAAVILLACCPCASALNPSLDINQYGHNAWTSGDGFFKGTIHAIAQTPDGYLWLATEFGLLRFDGVRSVAWEPPAGQHLPSSIVSSLLAGRDGRLWIGTLGGLASWNDGKLAQYPNLAGLGVQALLEDREGTVWAGGWGTPTGRLCAIQSGSVRCYGQDGSLGNGVLSLYEDSGGNLWAGASTGLRHWKPGPPRLYPMPSPEIRALIDGDIGTVLISLPDGIRQLVDGTIAAYSLPGVGRQFSPHRFFRDRNDGLWIGTTDQGLLHVHNGRTDVYGQPDGLSGDFIENLFEDREGSIWVATENGLDRFRDLAVPTISVKQGLSNSSVWSVLAARDGGIWLGTRAGLNRWNNGQITIYSKRSSGLPNDAESLFQDDRGRIWVSTIGRFAYFEDGRFIPVGAVPAGNVHSMAGDSTGNLWIGDQDHGLLHLREGSVVEQIPWTRLGRGDFAYALFPEPTQGGLWLGFYHGGLAYFDGGHVRASYAARDGLGEGQVTDLRLDRDGSLWAATDGGLSRVKDGRVVTLSSKNGLPCDTVHWIMEDDEHSVWLYLACGLVRIARPDLDAWAHDPKRNIQPTVFDSSDGVRNHALAGGYSPRVAKSKDGKLWFPSGDGVSVIDPGHIPFNKLPPPVHIEQITADRKTYEASPNRRLPPLIRDLEIDYTALSLVAPEKNRFKYKLEGHDRDWQDVGNRRQAFYNDLAPRNYKFRVIASNNSGVWNETGDTFDFSIAPAYYQTTLFRASVVAAFLLMLWGLYRYRLHQMAREFNANLEGRVDERLRVARELHDTLLQSFHGLLPQFQAARNLLRGRAEDVAQVLDTALGDATQAITEARDAVQNMRASTVISNELAKTVEVLAEEIAARQREAHGDAPAFHIHVEGAVQELHPIVRDEIYRIASEALRNAYVHARARRIEVEIRYDPRTLRVLVRDDGIGIDAKLIETGRPGHWGLPGMRERAKAINSQLEVWSEQGAGTEVQLIVPASVAYGTHSRQRPANLAAGS